MPTIFLCIILLLILTVFVCARKISFFSKKRKENITPDEFKGSLTKCIQQYVINPNYYSSSPDASLKKLLQEIEIPAEKVTFMEEIGEGCFGRVYRGKYQASEDEVIPVAIKVLKEDVGKDVGNTFELEVEILSNFRHPNIVKLMGVIIKETIPSMVFEYMAWGDLTEILRKKDPKKQKLNKESNESVTNDFLTEDDLIWIATQISAGMAYLASQHFVHRDLATRNCLVTHNLTVKISDFGLSRDIYTCDYYKVNGTKMLPIRWMSPESIIYGKYTLESDVWSFGVVLWEIFAFGKQPYYGHSNDEAVKLILQGILLIPPEDCPEFICKLMAGCWKTEPKDRLNFDTIFKKTVENCCEERQKIMNKIAEEFMAINEEVVSVENYLIPTSLNPIPLTDIV